MIKTSPAANDRATSRDDLPQGTHTTQPTTTDPTPIPAASAGSTTSLNGHTLGGPHRTPAVEGSASQRATKRTSPISGPLAGFNVRNGQGTGDIHERYAVADFDHPDSHQMNDTHEEVAVGARTSPQAKPASKPILPAPVGFKIQPTAKAPTTSIEHPLSAGHPTP